jgi:hypothetical protein
VSETRQPAIEWSHIASWAQWLAQERDGQLRLFEVEPEPSPSGTWRPRGGLWEYCTAFASARKGQGDWAALLVKRPGLEGENG